MAVTQFPTPNVGSLPLAVNEFTSAGTYTVPTGATWARIICVGGGGSGGRGTAAAGGGGSGYMTDRLVAVTAGATHSVTIGAGGAGKTTDGAGNAGGTTSVGSLASANGGTGGGSSSSVATSGVGERNGFPGYQFWDGSTLAYSKGQGGGGFFGGNYGGGTTGSSSNTSAGQSGYVLIYSY